MSDLLSIALAILAIFYILFALLAIFRLIKILREKNILCISIFFYISLFISSGTRSSTFCIIFSNNTLKSNLMYFLLFLPDEIALCVFLILIWHCLMTYASSHSQLADDGGVFDKSDELRITKKIEYVLYIVMPIYLVSFIVICGLEVSSILTLHSFFYTNACLNMGTPLILIVLFIFLKFKFSGRPYKNARAKLETRDLFILTSIWSVERIAIGILEVILTEFGYLEYFINNIREYSTKFLYPFICVVYFLATELVPDYLVLDYNTMITFIKKKKTDILIPDGIMSTNAIEDSSRMTENAISPTAVININSKSIHFKDLILNEEIFRKKKGLGVIRKGTYKGKDIVCREITFDRITRYDQEGIYTDIENLIKLTNENICPLVGYCVEDDNKIYIVTDYYQNGSLFDYLHNKKKTMSYIEKIKCALAIAQGMKYLHEHDVYHFHFSSRNILIEDNKNPLIADYGFENLKNIASIFNRYTNKNSYSSPEILQDAKSIAIKGNAKESNAKIDIYSFGILLWELLTETIPFDVKLSELIKYVVELDCRPEITKSVDEKMKKLIRACWSTEPSSRPGIDVVILALQEKSINTV